MARKIAVVTGSRSDWGYLKPVARAIREDPGLRLVLVAAGMHFLKTFGNSVDEIRKDGFSVDFEAHMESERDDFSAAMALSVSEGIRQMSKIFIEAKPDIVLVLGDRVEALAAAIAGAYANIPVAHMHGGDNARGGIDELARGAITKFSHIHFPATKKSAKRIERMGEEKWRIFEVGSSAIDNLMEYEIAPRKSLFEKYGFDAKKKLLLVVQHPVSTEPNEAKWQMEETLGAIANSKMQALVIYPNSDAGGRQMIGEIKKYDGKIKGMKSCANIPHLDYVSFLKHAYAIVGNSSSAIIEACYFGTPAINVGTRQEGRERGGNVIDVPHDRNEILKAIKSAGEMKAAGAKCPYGGGKTAQKTAKVLKTIEISKKLLQKKMMDE